MSKHAEKTHYLTYLALELLEKFGNRKPTQGQIDLAEDLLSNIAVTQKITFNRELTDKEISCLYWAAMGKTSKQTAKLLNLEASTVEAHRKEIKRKLSCNTIAQAIFEGIRYGFMAPKDGNNLP